MAELAEILVVEDDAVDAEMIGRALARASAPATRVVRTGEDALALLGVAGPAGRPPLRPRVLVLDLKLPRVSGLEVLERVRAHEATRALPVVMLSSSREREDLERCYAAGANSYLVKPLSFGELAGIVAALVGYWCGTNEAPPGFGEPLPLAAGQR